MKKYKYSLKPIRYMVAKALCPAYLLGIIVSVAVGLPLYLLILMLIILGIFFSSICLWWYMEIRPDILGEVVIDKEKYKLKIYRPKMEDSEFDISEISEIRYARDGGLYIRTKREKVYTFNFRIVSTEEKEFEKEIRELGKKYNFHVLILWKRRDVETGKKLSEIVKEDAKLSGGKNGL